MERWKLNLYTIWLTQVISLMSFNFGLPFLSFYIQDMGVTDPSNIKMFVGILTSLTAVSMAIMSPVWGRLADKHGKKLMLLRAIFAGGLVLICIGFATNVYQLMFLRFLQGVFTGSATAASALVASSAPDNRLGYALGFLATSSQVGSSVGPALGGMVAESFGYRNSFILGGVLLIVDFLLVLFLVQDSNTTSDIRIKINPVEEEQVQKKPFYGTWLLVGMVLIFFVRFTTTIFNPYMPIYVQEKLGTLQGASRITGLVSGFIGIMTAMSGFILGSLSDRYNRVNLLKIYAFLSFLVALPLFLAQEIWTMALIYGIMMFMLGGIDPIIMSVSCARVDRNQRGRLFGLQGLISAIGWGLSPLLGSVVSINFSVKAILLVIPMLLLGQFLIATFFGKKLLS